MLNVALAGASKGIGFEIFKNLISNPAINKIIAISRSEMPSLPINNESQEKYEWITCDLSSESEINNIKIEHSLQINSLIYNAGILINKNFSDTTEKEWYACFQNNFFGAVRLIKLLLPNLLNASVAHVVLIGSMGGFQGSKKYKGLSAYSCSKGALAILAECLAEEFNKYNIHVNCLCLGSVNTDMFKIAFPGFKASMTAHEIGKYIADFSINGNKYFNGKIIPVSPNTP